MSERVQVLCVHDRNDCDLCDWIGSAPCEERQAGLPASLTRLPDGWIRCSERMPEFVTVQFAFRHNEYGIGVRVTNFAVTGTYHGSFWMWDNWRIETDHVVAWRPLTVPAEVRGL